MPYVRVLLSERARSGEFISCLEAELPRIIAEEMEVGSEASLTANDIDLDGESVFGGADGVPKAFQRPRVLSGDVSILVWGENYPDRVVQGDEIAQRIGERVKLLMPPGLKAYAWVLLCEGSFSSFRS